MVTPPSQSDEVALVAYPVGVPDPSCFELRTTTTPAPGSGELLVRVTDLSLDPYLRSAITGRHIGHSRMALGTVMPGRAVAEVAWSEDASHPVGSWVLAETGWREWAVVPATTVTPVDVPPGVPRSTVLGALGMPGLTAYAAMTRHLRPVVGDTVVVSSATGGVGSVAGQLARLAGARTVAIVGDEDKARLATDVFGYAATVLRTDADWRDALSQSAPDGVHCYLHMGDAQVLDGVVRALAVGARVSIAGLMDQYNERGETTVAVGPLVGARATVHGMVVYDHHDLADEHRTRVGRLLASGDLRVHEERHRGLSEAPAAFSRLMAGANRGKVVVEVGG